MKIDSINFVTSEISGSIVGATRAWQGHVQSNGTITEEQYWEEVGKTANRSAEDVGYVLSCARKTRKALLAKGYQVNCGDVTYTIVLRGSFERPDSSFELGRNKLEVLAIPRGALRWCLNGLRAINLVKPPTPTVLSIMDAVTGAVGTLVRGNQVTITGREIVIDAAHADEGVWLEDIETGEKVAQGSVVSTTRQTDKVTFADWPAPGEYRLCLASRAGMPAEYALIEIRKAVTVIAD